jgi:hypothetical protein
VVGALARRHCCARKLVLGVRGGDGARRLAFPVKGLQMLVDESQASMTLSASHHVGALLNLRWPAAEACDHDRPHE